MSDSFNQVKSQIGRRMVLGGVILVVVWVLAGSVLPSAVVGAVRVVLVIAFLGGVIYMAVRMGGGVLNQRRADVEALAARAGYGFEPTPGVSEGAEFLESLNHFALFADERGVLGKRPDDEADVKAAKVMDLLGNLDLTNRITGTTGLHQFQAFDFRYSPHQASRMVERTTAFLISVAGADLPSIRLIPRASAGAVGKLFAKLGGSEIELPDQPDFGQQFILRGSDKQAVEALFSLGLVSRFDQLGREFEDATVEAAGDQLLLYRFGALAEGDQFDALLSAGTRIADALAPR